MLRSIAASDHLTLKKLRWENSKFKTNDLTFSSLSMSANFVDEKTIEVDVSMVFINPVI